MTEPPTPPPAATPAPTAAEAPVAAPAAAQAETQAEAQAEEKQGASVDVLATTQAEWAKCPACGVQNATEARFCERCGSELPHPEAATLMYAPRAGSGGTERAASGAATVVSAGGAPGQVPVLTHTLSGTNSDTLLQLVRRDLADDYDVDCEIGRGGMAIVYRAVERQLRRTVALKVLPPDLLLGPQVVERFKREAQMAAALDHPNIIPIYRVGETSSLIYLAMRYVEGLALDRMITGQGPLPLPVVILVLRAATAALAYAHAHGIVHRDVKGGNIVDREGRVIVTDFGVARAIDNASMTTTGSVIGTPYYMSPEQCAGKVVGPQSDQYSLGVVTFQMLVGAVPFQADTLAAIMHHHFFTPAPDVTKAREDVPPALAAVLSRALSKDPERRFASTNDMLAAVDAIPLSTTDRAKGEAMLRDLAQGTTLPTVRTSALPPLADTMTVVAAHDAFRRSADRIRRVRRRLGGIAALVLAAALVLWVTVRPTTRSRGTADTTAITRARAVVVPPPPSPVPPVAMGRPSTIRSRTVVPVAPAGTPILRRRMMPPVPDTTHAVAVQDTATGKLRVRAKPGDADIQVDGEIIGQGAIIDREVLAGPRHLHISAPGYVAFDTAIVIVAGETTRLNPITLKAEP